MGDKAIEKVHFIGIGGVGMSGIASVAAEEGLLVSGSDIKESKYSKILKEEGIEVVIGQKAANIDRFSPDAVVVSSAIPESNPELARAREVGVDVLKRAQMLAYVCKPYDVLAVAGTHGKTTTSSMLASALVSLGADPAFLVGGILGQFGTNARHGQGRYCAIEADESDGSFVYLDPYVAVVTNIEADHLDHYADIDEIRAAFAEFISDVPEEGAAVVCADAQGALELARSSCKGRVVSYGTGEGCDVRVFPLDGGGFEVEIASSGERAQGKLPANPGIHNMLNAAAVVAVLAFLGYGAQEAMRAVCAFEGVRRRFDRVGGAKGVEVVDDYGHHPTEIAATLAAARGLGYKRVHVLFQPHRYSRTQALADQFAHAFDDADAVTVMDVYSAGEAPIPGVTGKTVVDSVLACDPGKDIRWVERRAEVVPSLADRLEEGDLLITMGAGDVTSIGPLVIEALEASEAPEAPEALEAPEGSEGPEGRADA